jgi:hypothetical protein
MKKQRCPICKEPVEPSSRYPRYVCVVCVASAESKDGQPVEAVNAEAWSGIELCLRDSGQPIDGDRLYIQGVECVAREAHFGGVVIQPIALEKPGEPPCARAFRVRGRQRA